MGPVEEAVVDLHAKRQLPSAGAAAAKTAANSRRQPAASAMRHKFRAIAICYLLPAMARGPQQYTGSPWRGVVQRCGQRRPVRESEADATMLEDAPA